MSFFFFLTCPFILTWSLISPDCIKMLCFCCLCQRRVRTWCLSWWVTDWRGLTQGIKCLTWPDPNLYLKSSLYFYFKTEVYFPCIFFPLVPAAKKHPWLFIWELRVGKDMFQSSQFGEWDLGLIYFCLLRQNSTMSSTNSI